MKVVVVGRPLVVGRGIAVSVRPPPKYMVMLERPLVVGRGRGGAAPLSLKLFGAPCW